jgi:glutamate-1-semialdehyde 2,1-aminomutase
MSPSFPKSAAIIAHSRRYIPGGVNSINRAIQPEITFVRGEGAYIYDADGRRYIDYHAAFSPHFLGHNDPHVREAVIGVLTSGESLFGAGSTMLEGRLAELICTHVPWVEELQIVNTGSEATCQAIRLARAVTGRDHVIVMQGGYNGWHNDVACNLMTPLSRLGPRRSPGEYPFIAISAGIPQLHQQLVHPINFNDLDSVRYVCERHPIAALITEPILQNIGVIKPQPGYLAGLRRLADEFGFALIFDEVKTGFRHALGGYAEVSGVRPDLVVYGKAVANGFPIAMVGGRRDYMDWFVHADPAKRVLAAGTYNGHPVPVAASIATIERLLANNGEVYRHVEMLGARMERGLVDLIGRHGLEAVVARQGSAFCLYFMDHLPVDWHDLAEHHDFARDERVRQEMIQRGVFAFPLATKQWSLSAAHTAEDVDVTLKALDAAFEAAQLERGAATIAFAT